MEAPLEPVLSAVDVCLVKVVLFEFCLLIALIRSLLLFLLHFVQ